MSEKQVQSASEPIELTTYEKKVVCSEIPAFVTLLGNNKISLLDKVNEILSEQYTSFAMRAFALMVQGFLSFEETPEDHERVVKAQRILSKLAKVDPAQVLAHKIAKHPENALVLIRDMPANQERILNRISRERSLIEQATTGAQRAAQVGFDRGLKYGELRDGPSQATGHRAEILDPGVYQTRLGKDHAYRFVFESAHSWELWAVNGEKVTFCASYDQVKAKSDDPEFDPRVSSATRARKVAKVCKVGYRGYASLDALPIAFLAKFADMSAGNPTIKNWNLVDSQPLVWLESAKSGKLPREIII